MTIRKLTIRTIEYLALMAFGFVAIVLAFAITIGAVRAEPRHCHQHATVTHCH